MFVIAVMSGPFLLSLVGAEGGVNSASPLNDLVINTALGANGHVSATLGSWRCGSMVTALSG